MWVMCSETVVGGITWISSDNTYIAAKYNIHAVLLGQMIALLFTNASNQNPSLPYSANANVKQKTFNRKTFGCFAAETVCVIQLVLIIWCLICIVFGHLRPNNNVQKQHWGISPNKALDVSSFWCQIIFQIWFGLEHFYKGQKTPSNTHLHLAFIFSGKRCDQPFFLGQMTLQWSGIYWLRLQLAVMEICHPGWRPKVCSFSTAVRCAGLQ